jgi:hypothetical protein
LAADGGAYGQSILPCRTGNLREKFFWARSSVAKMNNTSGLSEAREDIRKPGRETAGKPVLLYQIIDNSSSSRYMAPTDGEVNGRIGAPKEEKECPDPN